VTSSWFLIPQLLIEELYSRYEMNTNKSVFYIALFLLGRNIS